MGRGNFVGGLEGSDGEKRGGDCIVYGVAFVEKQC